MNPEVLAYLSAEGPFREEFSGMAGGYRLEMVLLFWEETMENAVYPKPWEVFQCWLGSVHMDVGRSISSGRENLETWPGFDQTIAALTKNKMTALYAYYYQGGDLR